MLREWEIRAVILGSFIYQLRSGETFVGSLRHNQAAVYPHGCPRLSNDDEPDPSQVPKWKDFAPILLVVLLELSFFGRLKSEDYESKAIDARQRMYAYQPCSNR